MITGIVILHLLTHELPALCLGLYVCFKYFKQQNNHVCCDHSEEK